MLDRSPPNFVLGGPRVGGLGGGLPRCAWGLPHMAGALAGTARTMGLAGMPRCFGSAVCPCRIRTDSGLTWPLPYAAGFLHGFSGHSKCKSYQASLQFRPGTCIALGEVNLHGHNPDSLCQGITYGYESWAALFIGSHLWRLDTLVTLFFE